MTPAPFDVLGDLPTGTTVLEASAGTGKTWTIGALVTRYVAEGHARLDELLVVTFGRAASRELSERVRAQLVEAERALADPATASTDDPLIAHLLAADVEARHRRVVDALADFDAATIATIHQFCHLVLKSLGVAGDTDGRAELVEDLDELTVEVAEDLYLERFRGVEKPPFPLSEALGLARAALADPQAHLVPDPVDDPLDPESRPAQRRSFAQTAREEVERRKHRRGVLSYDDLLSRLADALDATDAPARERMRQRWRIVLVDEFQDTDPVQWSVFHRAFSGAATLVLVGDPKQAIYAFRGGDIVTYLDAAATAGERRTLAVNWRSDAPLVDALQVLTRGTALGDPRITVLPVSAHHQGSRLGDVERSSPVRLRVVRTEDRPLQKSGTLAVDLLRPLIADDVAADIADVLAGGASYDGRALVPADIAVLMPSLGHADLIRDALRRRGIASVVASGGSVLLSPAAAEWLTLLEALESQRPARVRALGLTSFVGETAESLDLGGDALTDLLAERARSWLDLFRSRGIAAVHEAAYAAGLPARVLARPDGERLLTDLDHLGQMLHDVARRQRLGLPALLEWLRAERRATTGADARIRRLDTDAAAVQILTYHGSKGLQWPMVYLPWLFDAYVADATVHRFHDAEGRRTLDVGFGKDSPHRREALAEETAEELRIAYVALTRAQSQVVCWYAPSWNSRNSGLARLLFGRRQGEAAVPDSVANGPTDAEVAAVLDRWQEAGALSVEVVGDLVDVSVPDQPSGGPLTARRFDRAIDTAWRRTSYSGLIRAEEQSAGVLSEPEVAGTIDEDDDADDPVASPPAAVEPERDLVSPMADLPAGAGFGSLVHAVLEHADPEAIDLRAELAHRIVEQRRWWPVDVATDELAEALVPMQHTPLGPLADDLTLAEIPLRERLRELDFEFPLAGGDHEPHGPDVPLRDVGTLLRRFLADDDPMRAYADRLESPVLGDQVLRGYLSGSVDAVLRTPAGRWLVVDYKTNRLGAPDRPLTALDYTQPRMTEAMLHSHYPLQALLYSVVLHRYLRWRLPDYDPEEHLGGVLYLYLRGMCGPETPRVEGQPCGVFAWRPPADLVVALSGLLAGDLSEVRA